MNASGAHRVLAALVVGCLAVAVAAVAGTFGSAQAQTRAPSSGVSPGQPERVVVRAPERAGETVVDVPPGATVVLDGDVYAEAAFSIDDDDLVVTLPRGRTLILGGFFVGEANMASLAVGRHPPVSADRLARNGFASLLAPPSAAVEPAAGLSPPAGQSSAEPVVVRRLVKFLDGATRERSGFGAYTHLLFSRPDPRHEVLLAALFAAERSGRNDAPDSRRTTFYLPMRDATAARIAYDAGVPRAADRGKTAAWRNMAARLLAAEIYDYGRTQALLQAVCAREGAGVPAFCGRASGGPYLLNSERPLPPDGSLPSRFLVIDLSTYAPPALETWARALVEHAMAARLSARQRLTSLRTAAERLAAELGDGNSQVVFASSR